MIYNFRNAQIFYKFFNRKKAVTNVFLHGWGCDNNSLGFCDFSEQNALFVDFPPFGKSSEVKDWTIFTYANMVISLCQHLKLEKVNLIGHSFGGRVAILFSAFNSSMVNKLVLVDSAGLKPKRSIGYFKRVFVYKIRKKMGFDVSKYGSCDYLALSKNMQKVFINVVNTHLDDFLPRIKAETLIIFGRSDNVTPLYMAKKFHKKIKNSKLIVLEDAGHFCFVEKRLEFLAELKKFLKE